MKNLLICSVIIVSFFLNAAMGQVGQSSSSLDWKYIENKQVKIVYPDYIEDKAYSILSLINHYASDVNKSFDQSTPKFTLILRSEMATFNGFVTLAPRRTEWFSSATLTPLIGSLDWYQSLAIHEFRHLAQYEFLSKDNTKYGYYFFGEIGLSLFINIMTPSWYFEGDAVWAETVYSDGGRGRSARFSQRMKALLTQGIEPTLDELLAGNYLTPMPNHYVYGYFLTTYAYKKFGKDIWAKVLLTTRQSPLNPYSLYSSFEDVTGQNFDEFYKEMISDLKLKWAIKPIENKKEEYHLEAYPTNFNGSLRYFKRSLDSLWIDSMTKKELPLNPRLSKIAIQEDFIVYAQIRPHPRFAYKQYQDLYLFDGKNTKRLTNNQRAYHPAISKDKKKIAYIHFSAKNIWSVKVINLKGDLLQEISVPGLTIAEVAWIDSNRLALISLNDLAKKRIEVIDTRDDKRQSLTNLTRNNIYNLHSDSGIIYFEADYNGIVNIFSLSAKTKIIKQCTAENLGAHDPFVIRQTLTYSQVTAYGTRAKSTELNCTQITDLLGIELHSKNPSNNYFDKDSIALKAKNIESISAKSKAYPETSGSLSPHSWSFITARGFGVDLTMQNEISSLFLNTSFGSSALENKPFASLNIGYYKYYPLIDLNIDYIERKKEYSLNKESDQWSEANTALSITLPYYNQFGLYSFSSSIFGSYQSTHISKKRFSSLNQIQDDQLNTLSSGFNISFLKEKSTLAITPRFGATLLGTYLDIKAQNNGKVENYSVSSKLNLYLPGLLNTQSLVFKHDYFSSKDSLYAYDIAPNTTEFINPYLLSRGYTQSEFNSFEKLSLNYYSPLFYTDFAVWDFLYMNRIYANFFYDHSFTKDEANRECYDSYGAEIFFDTLLVRKLPIGFYYRHVQKLRSQTSINEAGLNITAQF